MISTAYAAEAGAEARRLSGCRHNESVKIRMLPPAVLTYSTLPAAIQLYMVRRLTPTISHAFMMLTVWRSIFFVCLHEVVSDPERLGLGQSMKSEEFCGHFAVSIL